MSDAPPLPAAVVAIAHVPVSGHVRGEIITDAETIASIYRNGQQRSVTAVHPGFAAAHTPKEG